MSQFSRQVTQQMNNAEELQRAIETHQKRITDKMLDKLKPYLSTDEQKNFSAQLNKVFGAQLTHLKKLTQQIGDIDLNHSKEILETQEARMKRDLVIQETFQTVASLKQAISGSHGEHALVLLGMTGQTPRHPRELERWLANVINIASAGVNMPKTLFAGMPAWNANGIEAFVKPVYEKLQNALNQVSKEQHEDKDTMTDKWRLMEEQNYVYTAIASIAESYARFGGDHDLGDRLRPRTTARSGRTRPGEEGEATPDTPELTTDIPVPDANAENTADTVAPTQ